MAQYYKPKVWDSVGLWLTGQKYGVKVQSMCSTDVGSEEACVSYIGGISKVQRKGLFYKRQVIWPTW